MAKGLLNLGIRKDDKVAIWATNVPEWYEILFASAKIGAILVTVNTNYKEFELEYLLKQSDTKMLVMIAFGKPVVPLVYCILITSWQFRLFIISLSCSSVTLSPALAMSSKFINPRGVEFLSPQ